MTIEEEIAEAMIGVQSADLPGMAILGDNEGDRADARALAAALSPLLNRVRAEAWRQGHAAGRDYQGDGWNCDAHDPEEDNPYIEQNSEGNTK